MFDILIATYNREAFLPRCLNSVINQVDAPKGYKIYILDDNSTDNSYDIIKKYIEKYPDLIVYKKEYNHSGCPGYLYNRLIEMSQNKYFINVDSDDYLFPQALNRFATFINNLQDKNFGIVYADQYFQTDEANMIPHSYSQLEVNDENMRTYNPIRQPFCINKEISTPLGNFDELHCGVLSSLMFKIYSTGAPIHHIKEFLYVFDRTTHPQITREHNAQQRQNFLNNVEKYL